jgi:hypothetical protein
LIALIVVALPASSVAALGDTLVLIGCVFYGISNIGQEYLVKTYDRLEYLGMLGLFGALVSGVQMVILERDALSAVSWSGLCGTLAAACAQPRLLVRLVLAVVPGRIQRVPAVALRADTVAAATIVRRVPEPVAAELGLLVHSARGALTARCTVQSLAR